MKKSFIECPFGCKDGDKPLKLTVSGSSMHVKVKHPEKYQEFKDKFADFKKNAVIMDTATRTPAASGSEPPKVDDQAGYGDKEKKEPPVKAPGGDDKPPQGKSFLRELDEYLDSPIF